MQGANHLVLPLRAGAGAGGPVSLSVFESLLGRGPWTGGARPLWPLDP